MRLLIYGMMSSGATSFALYLAQRPDALALVDILNNFAAPRVHTKKDIMAKVTMTTAYPLAVHMERFRPDKVVLFLRDPRDIYMSLRTKPYRNYAGLMEEKFQILDHMFTERDRFDAVIHYEDFVTRQANISGTMRRLGWPVEPEYYTFRRTHNEIMEDLWRDVPDLYQNLELNFGNVRGTEVSEEYTELPRDPKVEPLMMQWCPRIMAHYIARERTEPWVEQQALERVL